MDFWDVSRPQGGAFVGKIKGAERQRLSLFIVRIAMTVVLDFAGAIYPKCFRLGFFSRKSGSGNLGSLGGMCRMFLFVLRFLGIMPIQLCERYASHRLARKKL
jgi:hypothetical protein